MKNYLTKRPLRIALGALALGSALLPLLIFSILADKFFYRQIIEQQEKSLLGATQIIERSLPDPLTQAWCLKIVDQLPFRITVVRIKDSVRLCDSLAVDKIGHVVENAAQYEEFTSAIRQGQAVIYRESTTLKEPVVYAIKRSRDGEKIVRLGFSLKEAEKNLKYFERGIFLFAGFFILLALIFNGIYFRIVSTILKKLLRTIDEKHIAFLDHAAHELRTPLASLLSSISTLKETPNLSPADEKRFLEIIFRNAKRLELLTKDFLTLSTLESGARHLVPLESLDTKEITELAITSVKPMADHRNIRLEVRTDAQKLWGHAFSVDQVLTNYLTNAVKYSPSASKVLILWSEFDDGTLLCVEDEGPGIKTEDLPQVFDRFFRARSQIVDANTPGTGLGLAIVLEILRQHHGKAWAENRKDMRQGACFYAWFPSQK